MSEPDFYDVQDWTQAGSPLDKSFRVIRKSRVERNLETDLQLTCNRVIFTAQGYKRDTGAKAITIEADDNLSYPLHLLSYRGFSFSTYCDGGTLEAAGIVTLHSKEQQ